MPERKFSVLLGGVLVCSIWAEAVEDHTATVVLRRGPIVARIEKRPEIAVIENMPSGGTGVIWQAGAKSPPYWRNWR